MRRILGTLLVITAMGGLTAIAAGIDFKTSTDQLIHGVPGSTDDKSMEFDTGDGASNVKLTVDDSRDASLSSNKLSIGDGASSDKTLEANDGSSPAPAFKWNSTLSRWEFSNDGTSFRAVGSGSGGGGINLLAESNFDFESGTSSWTNSGGTLTNETTNELNGNASGNWVANGATDTLTSALIAIPERLYGKDCLLSMPYRWDGGTLGELNFQVWDGSSVLSAVELTPTGASPESELVSIYFTCPTSGSLAARVLADSSEPALILDDVHLGSNNRIQEVAQAEIYAISDLDGATNCNWSTTSGTYASFAVDSDCGTPTVTGKATAPATKIPALTFPTLEVGKYVFNVQGGFVVIGGTSTSECVYQLHDGTSALTGQMYLARNSANRGTNSNLIATLDVTSTQSNVTVEVQGARPTGDGSCDILNTATGVTSLAWTVERFPLSSQAALSVDTSQAGGTLKWALNSACVWQTTSGTYGDFGADAQCNDPTVTGSAEAPGTKVPHGLFNKMPAGEYDVKFQALFNSNNSTSGAQDCQYQYTTSAGTIEGQLRTLQAANEGGDSNSTLLGRLTLASFASQVEIKVQGKRLTGNGNCDVAADQTDALMVLTPVTEFKTVHFDNLMTSSASDGRKFVSALIDNPGTPVVTRQDGLWIDSITDTGLGDITLNLTAGVFSTAPDCRVAGIGSVVSNVQFHSDVSTSAARVLSFDSTEAAADADFYIECSGN